MQNLIVTNRKLKPEYRRRNWWWNRFFKKFFLKYSESVWKNQALIAYPLTIDIELGTMRYFYMKYGFTHVYMRITKYNVIMVARLTGRGDIVDFLEEEDFYEKTVLIREEDIKDQLDKEISEIMMN